MVVPALEEELHRPAWLCLLAVEHPVAEGFRQAKLAAEAVDELAVELVYLRPELRRSRILEQPDFSQARQRLTLVVRRASHLVAVECLQAKAAEEEVAPCLTEPLVDEFAYLFLSRQARLIRDAWYLWIELRTEHCHCHCRR